ncbi:hypothetical protein NRB56_28450 [Nocardia sp. RB56]|uniref:Uncharacterized protein n=1 Tax=Nocardia aurantia TaxID=2585199 RepID=A0A7K0DPE6_9NOCA|nr:hypothetical protein [Nocardia aurantia]
MNSPDTRTARTDVFLSQAMDLTVLDTVIRLNVTAGK